MDLLEVLFSNNIDKAEDESENVGDEELLDDEESMINTNTQPLMGKQLPVYSPVPKRGDRGKFTILEEGEEILEKAEIMEYNFTQVALKRLFADGFVTSKFLVQFGLIPNQRHCPVEGCPRDQFMSLIKHTNGFVWRCRACRKRREGRLITKVSVYDSTFLFYSRMPLSKLFLFMHAWSENTGCSPAEYNRILGDQRLVEETIHNTIGFLRDNIQQWMALTQIPHTNRIGEPGGFVEILETISYNEQPNGRANRASRRERRFDPTYIILCLSTNNYCLVAIKEQPTLESFIEMVNDRIAPECTVIVKDRFLYKLGDEEFVENIKYHPLEYGVTISTISDKWFDLSCEEKEKQFIKTEIEQCISTGHDNYHFEYVWRRIFHGKRTFNGLLTILRELFELKGENTRPPIDENSLICKKN